MYRNVVTEMVPDRNGQTEMSRDRNGPNRNGSDRIARPKSPVPALSETTRRKLFLHGNR